MATSLPGRVSSALLTVLLGAACSSAPVLPARPARQPRIALRLLKRRPVPRPSRRSPVLSPARPHAYAVFVDEADAVWVSDFGANTILRFDPVAESFTSFPAESQPAEVRQLLGRAGEVWGAESAADRLVAVRWTP